MSKILLKKIDQSLLRFAGIIFFKLETLLSWAISSGYMSRNVNHLLVLPFRSSPEKQYKPLLCSLFQQKKKAKCYLALSHITFSFCL